MACPLNQSIDVLKPSQIGCVACDARSLNLLKPEMINNFLHRKQLKWKWESDKKVDFLSLNEVFCLGLKNIFHLVKKQLGQAQAS